MGRPSTINRLPEGVREALHGWLNDPAITQAEATERVNAMLAEIAPEHLQVSCQAVNRYDQRYREVTRQLRESREVSSRMVAEMGSRPGGEMGHLLTEMIRVVSFRVTAAIQEAGLAEEAIPGLIKQLKDLSLISRRVESAARTSEQREREILERAAEEAAAAIKKRAKQEPHEKGLSAETADMVKHEILGIDISPRHSP